MGTAQENIINALGVKPEINVQEEIRTRIDFLKNIARSTKTKGFVLGISGGQDSALAGKLAQIAVHELNDEQKEIDYRFVALLLPYGTQADATDAGIIAYDFIEADEVQEFNIKAAVDAFAETFNATNGDSLPDYHKGNVKARIRAVTQYAYAGDQGLLVLGTDHAGEAVSGFFTKFGDGAADVLPLAGLDKRQGKALLRELGAPDFVIKKAPTADLLDKTPGQADETELGVTYNQLDDYLEGKPVPVDTQEKIEARYNATEHKRQLPITIFDTWWK